MACIKVSREASANEDAVGKETAFTIAEAIVYLSLNGKQQG